MWLFSLELAPMTSIAPLVYQKATRRILGLFWQSWATTYMSLIVFNEFSWSHEIHL